MTHLLTILNVFAWNLALEHYYLIRKLIILYSVTITTGSDSYSPDSATTASHSYFRESWLRLVVVVTPGRYSYCPESWLRLNKYLLTKSCSRQTFGYRKVVFYITQLRHKRTFESSKNKYQPELSCWPSLLRKIYNNEEK